jgi:hypothetical protein
MGALPLAASWFSYARWFVECLYVQETALLSDAWRMPPPFYAQPAKESAILGLQSMAYVEGSTSLDLLLLGLLGLLARALALVALVAANRDKMGLPPVAPVACLKRAIQRVTCRSGVTGRTPAQASAAGGSGRALSAALFGALGMQRGGSSEEDDGDESDNTQVDIELPRLRG